MTPPPPISTPTDPLFPYPTLFRPPAEPAFAGLGLVIAHQRDHAPRIVVVGEFDRRAEPDAALVGLPGGVDDARRLHASGEEAQAPIDLAQPLAAIDIVAILAAVAIARGPADHLHQLRPLAAQQRVIFGAQRGVAGGADDVRLVPRHAALTPACACRGRSSAAPAPAPCRRDRKSTRLNSSH